MPQPADGWATEVIEVTIHVHKIDYYGVECYVETKEWEVGVANSHWGNYHAAAGTTAFARQYPHVDGHGSTPVGGYVYEKYENIGRWTCDGSYVMEEVIVTPDDNDNEDEDDDDDEEEEDYDPYENPQDMADSGSNSGAG